MIHVVDGAALVGREEFLHVSAAGQRELQVPPAHLLDRALRRLRRVQRPANRVLQPPQLAEHAGERAVRP